MMTEHGALRAGVPPAVDPGVLHLLRETAADLSPQRTDLVQVLHERLLEVRPAMAHLPGRGEPVCYRLVGAVLHADDVGRDPGEVAVAVQQAGADNALDGIPEELYGEITHALLYTVRTVFRGEWSSTLSSAWVQYLLWLRGHLVAGAQSERPAGREAAAADPVPSGWAALGPAPVTGPVDLSPTARGRDPREH